MTKALDKNKPFAVALIKIDKYIILEYDSQGKAVRAFHTETDGVRYFEDSYNRAHSRSYEGSMSACINWMYLQPSIVMVDNLADLITKFAEPDGTVKLMDVGNNLCRVTGVNVTNKAKKLWDEGIKPRLIG
jgi:hypothetical protein